MPRPVAFVPSTVADVGVAAAQGRAPANEVAPVGAAAAAQRFAAVPDALRDALRKLAPPDVETALAFFAMEFGGRVGVHQLVLETEAGADVVLKLDFDERAWKRVRKKTRPPPAEASI